MLLVFFFMQVLAGDIPRVYPNFDRRRLGATERKGAQRRLEEEKLPAQPSCLDGSLGPVRAGCTGVEAADLQDQQVRIITFACGGENH